jgi:hypothetical protein
MFTFNKNLLKKLKNISVIKSIEKDRVLYLYSTGIALFFWVFLKLSKSYESNIDIKLDYNLGEQHAFIYSPPDFVNVTLAAKGWDLLSLNTINKGSLLIDVYGRQSNMLTAEELQSRISNIIGSDKSLKSLFLESGAINLEFDDRISKQVALSENYTFNFENGYDLKQDSVIIEPDSIILSGPAEVLEDIQNWPLVDLQFSNLNKEINQKVKLESAEPYAIDLSTQEVSLRVPVEQVVEKKIYVPIKMYGLPDSVIFYPRSVYLTCVVPMESFESITAKDFSIVADIDTSKTNNNIALLRLNNQNAKARSVRFEPTFAEFLIYKTPSSSN